jgi:hypothetical protein
VDDSCANPLVTQNGVETFAELYPKGGWSAEGIDEGRAKGYEYAWTGIIGMVRVETFSSARFSLIQWNAERSADADALAV